jgi:hypothetical protein
VLFPDTVYTAPEVVKEPNEPSLVLSPSISVVAEVQLVSAPASVGDTVIVIVSELAVYSALAVHPNVTSVAVRALNSPLLGEETLIATAAALIFTGNIQKTEKTSVIRINNEVAFLKWDIAKYINSRYYTIWDLGCQ